MCFQRSAPDDPEWRCAAQAGVASGQLRGLPAVCGRPRLMPCEYTRPQGILVMHAGVDIRYPSTGGLHAVDAPPRHAECKGLNDDCTHDPIRYILTWKNCWSDCRFIWTSYSITCDASIAASSTTTAPSNVCSEQFVRGKSGRRNLAHQGLPRRLRYRAILSQNAERLLPGPLYGQHS